MSNTISGTSAPNTVIIQPGDTVNDIDQVGSPPPLGSLGDADTSPDVSGSDLPPQSPTLSAPRPVRDGSYDGAAVTLSQLKVSAVNVNAIAKLMIENDFEGRKATRMDRAANREADAALQHQAADKMRDQAAFAFAASVTMSAVAIVGAGVSIAGSVKAGRVGMGDGPETTTAAPRVTETVDLPEVSTGKPASEQPQEIQKGKYTFRQEAPETTSSTATETETPSATAAQKAQKSKLEQEIEEADSSATIMKNNNDAQQIQMRYSGYSSIITELGKMGGAALNYKAAQADADKVDLQADASKARTRAEDDTDFIKAYSENIQAVIEKLSSIQESENDSMRQIVRG